MIRNRIGEMRLRRKSGGISKAHLARRLGISRSYVTKLEQGHVTPSSELMFRIADYFECPIEKIFSRETLPTPGSETPVRLVRGGTKQ